jgi:hypothetical protein
VRLAVQALPLAGVEHGNGLGVAQYGDGLHKGSSSGVTEPVQARAAAPGAVV